MPILAKKLKTLAKIFIQQLKNTQKFAQAAIAIAQQYIKKTTNNKRSPTDRFKKKK